MSPAREKGASLFFNLPWKGRSDREAIRAGSSLHAKFSANDAFPLKNIGKRAVQSLVNIRIPEPDDANAFRGDKSASFFIASQRFLAAMAVAVDLDSELQRRAIKVDNIRADRMLPPELKPVQLFRFEARPKLSFRRRRLAP